jgi:hypothetical protein
MIDEESILLELNDRLPPGQQAFEPGDVWAILETMSCQFQEAFGCVRFRPGVRDGIGQSGAVEELEAIADDEVGTVDESDL